MLDAALKSKADMEISEILRTVDLFDGLDVGQVRAFAEAGEIRVLERGELLFRRGEPSDRIFLLMDGAIEIIRATADQPTPVPVAYITPGELVGDMALLTGTPRGSDARIPEVAMIWELTSERFDRIAERIPGYGMRLARMFARRMQDLITHMRRQSRRKELTGKLRHFDMPTVVQTLINAKQNGLLSFMDDEGKTFAEVMLANGAIDRAWCGPLHGEEAFTEIFLLRDEGEFIFRSTDTLDPEAISPVAIEAPAMHVLMEAMRRSDELTKLRGEMPDLKRSFEAVTTALSWSDPADTDVAQAVLRLLRSPRQLDGLNELVPCSTYTLCRVAKILIDTRQVAAV
ncbi:MAG: cyclic nucleotide-binding domain-containing protein [Krumholzibacteria bacterium]|nr:cyclic nucleotide-binding domain-containing protein [Candidatus Krumholzibacteria bacterium]